ncbi:alpha-amylase family glycosyl hydrolase [Aeromicrobium sp. CF3.5]|uniref:alpha-amylase family glycosyl hydrolase n=1 Tax=Aeromicrobium sp. CF3.5 TaxID=3373078 RepID=UPI003EE72CDD
MNNQISDQPAADWWRQAVVYQIYPRSFADGSGDGIGDFAGVLSRIDHLADLGVDAVWFSPFYPSALNDGGYDVDDYRDVDPTIGSLADFDEVIAALHECGIKVIIDLVPNHCSDRHEWFRDAMAAGPGSRERSRFHFHDGAGEHGELPPNDWQAMFGGPAWTRVTESNGQPGQWYLHLFSSHQPDWDWSSADVRDDFLHTLAFWGDRGVDGFRVDVAMGMAKDMSEPFPSWQEMGGFPLLGLNEDSPYADGQHPLVDRDELTEIYADWRAVFNTYDPPLFAVAEAWVAPHRRGRYASLDSLGQAFNFDLLSAPWDAGAFTMTIRDNLQLAAQNGSSSTWVFSNHDVVRAATRFGGLSRSQAATLLALALPGSTYVYQGEELGLPEVDGIAAEHVQDPWAVVENGVMTWGRDGCRVPLPWSSDAPSFGFSTARAHLPQPEWFGQYAVDSQEDDPGSTLALMRRAIALRADLLADDHVEWLDLGPGVVAFRRSNGWVSVTTFDRTEVVLPSGRVLLRTDRRVDSRLLGPDATAWLVQDVG